MCVLQVVEEAINAKLWAPSKMTIPASFQAAACTGLDVQGVVATANALGAGSLNDMMVQVQPRSHLCLSLRIHGVCFRGVGCPALPVHSTRCCDRDLVQIVAQIMTQQVRRQPLGTFIPPL